MSAPSFRVYLAQHHDGRVSATLVRAWSVFFEGPPPAAYGESESDALERLAPDARSLLRKGGADLERYLWTDPFETHRVEIGVHPRSSVGGQPVIGRRRIPLRLTYATVRTEGGAWRVILPRYGWWMVVEELAAVPDVLSQAVASALLGEDPEWLYDFRDEGPERVVEWSPEVPRRAEPEPPEEAGGVLPTVADDWTAWAAAHRLPKLVGGSDDARAAAAPLLRDTPESVVVVGPPGTGKTTWVQKVARLRAAANKDRDTSVPRLWATSTERLLAGMRYLGEWQARLLEVAEALSWWGEILYVDRLLPLVRAQPSGSSLADLLLPGMLAGEFAVVAECTPEEWVQCRRLAPRLASALRVVELRETPPREMAPLLARYARRRGLSVDLGDAAAVRLVRHLGQFHRTARFPGKGFAFVDWLGAEGREGGPRHLHPADASRAFARWSGLPVELVSDEHSVDAKRIAARLREGVVGQDAACEVAAEVVARFKAGMDDPERPIGSLLFVGTTGVGKTELAKALARYLFGDVDRMVRLDMSEYQAPGSARRLLEVGRGVSSLASRVRGAPLSLVLLDELEKAGDEVFDLLLGVLGEGRLTDADGALVDFRSTLVVATSNVGAGGPAPVGFGDGAPDHEAAVRRHFRPEFFNRIDHVVPFVPLTPAALREIVGLTLLAVSRRAGLTRRGLRLDVDEACRARLADLGHDPKKGARPLQRVVEARVVTPIAVRLAGDPSLRDTDLKFRLVDGEPKLLE